MPTLSGLPEAVVVAPDVVPVLPEPPPPHAARTSIAAAADRLPRVLSCRVSTTTSLLLQSFAQRTPHLRGCQGRAALRPARRPRYEALAPPLPRADRRPAPHAPQRCARHVPGEAQLPPTADAASPRPPPVRAS